jgi:hypothetical protein
VHLCPFSVIYKLKKLGENICKIIKIHFGLMTFVNKKTSSILAHYLKILKLFMVFRKGFSEKTEKFTKKINKFNIF